MHLWWNLGLHIESTHLSYGFNAFDEADVYHAPRGGQTYDHPPLQWAAGLNVRCDVQGLAIPEVVHGGALLTLYIVACI